MPCKIYKAFVFSLQIEDDDRLRVNGARIWFRYGNQVNQCVIYFSVIQQSDGAILLIQFSFHTCIVANSLEPAKRKIG